MGPRKYLPAAYHPNPSWPLLRSPQPPISNPFPSYLQRRVYSCSYARLFTPARPSEVAEDITRISLPFPLLEVPLVGKTLKSRVRHLSLAPFSWEKTPRPLRFPPCASGYQLSQAARSAFLSDKPATGRLPPSSWSLLVAPRVPPYRIRDGAATNRAGFIRIARVYFVHVPHSKECA